MDLVASPLAPHHQRLLNVSNPIDGCRTDGGVVIEAAKNIHCSSIDEASWHSEVADRVCDGGTYVCPWVGDQVQALLEHPEQVSTPPQ